jgi:hypothetical protein
MNLDRVCRHCAKATHWISEGKAPPILISKLSASRSGRFTLEERAASPHLVKSVDGTQSRSAHSVPVGNA